MVVSHYMGVENWTRVLKKKQPVLLISEQSLQPPQRSFLSSSNSCLLWSRWNLDSQWLYLNKFVYNEPS